jgi:mono/diheme cytochrome c family protein
MKATGVLLMSLALSACSAEKSSRSTNGYAELEVPVQRLASDEARKRGRTLFRSKCALCHGESADGNGVRSKGLSAKPANFTSPEWRSNTTPRDVFRILNEGKRGTSMPAWPTLTDDQKWDVIAYVLSVAEDGP